MNFNNAHNVEDFVNVANLQRFGFSLIRQVHYGVNLTQQNNPRPISVSVRLARHVNAQYGFLPPPIENIGVQNILTEVGNLMLRTMHTIIGLYNNTSPDIQDVIVTGHLQMNNNDGSKKAHQPGVRLGDLTNGNFIFDF